MSRTNPYKKKKRQASKTLLMFGEGFSEGMFLRYLKNVYSFNIGVAITVKGGRGGNAKSIVIDAIKIPGAFDRKVVVLDNDKPKSEMVGAREEAKSKGIELLENTPCLEYLLISIINKKPSGKKSSWCKNEFKSRYFNKKKQSELSEYNKLFPKKLLDSKRLVIPQLDKLISIMEGK